MDDAPGTSQGRTREYGETDKRHRSVYERVMANPQSRQAYFNTTRGVLSGHPEHAETKELRRALNERAIAHLFNPDETLPRPVFYSPGIISVGDSEISAVTDRLAKLND